MDYMSMLKQYPMIVNHYKSKIEYARKLKRDKGLSDELTREDLEPIMNNALNMVKSNVPSSMKRPENISELAVELKKSGIAKEFGLRDSEIDTITAIATEKPAIKPAPTPMPQRAMNNFKKLVSPTRPSAGEMR
jgi:hypothetical protein